MTNRCTSWMQVSGEAYHLRSFMSRIQGTDPSTGHNVLIWFPATAPLGPNAQVQLQGYPETGQVEIQNLLWGIDWPLDSRSHIQVTGRPEDGAVTYRFETLDLPPDQWLIGTSEQFSELQFEVCWCLTTNLAGKFQVNNGRLEQQVALHDRSVEELNQWCKEQGLDYSY